MSQDWMPVVMPESQVVAVATEATFAAEVESWLARQSFAGPAATWSPRGNGLIAVRSIDDVARRAAALAEGSWGVIRRTHAPLWVQCMRVAGGWIVEVNGEAGPECFARRVQGERGRVRAVAGLLGRRSVYDSGRLMAVYLPRDVVQTPEEVARVVWEWLRGGLRAGYELRDQ